MWEVIYGRMPSGLIMLCAVLSAAVPWVVYAVNRKLHKMGDPPWQRGMDREPNDMPGRSEVLTSR